MTPLQIRHDRAQRSYTDQVLEFLKQMSQAEGSAQVEEAVGRLVKNFHRTGDALYEITQGRSYSVTADAFFSHADQKLTAVALGKFSPVDDYIALTVQFMLPEEFDRDIRQGSTFQSSPFLQGRDEALLSMDEALIRAFGARYNMPLPQEASEFWTQVHTIREHLPTLPMEERQKSKRWLDERHIIRAPGPHSLNETPTLARAYPMGGAIYVQSVYAPQPDRTLIVWLELIKEGKVFQRVSITGEFATQQAAVEAGMNATAEMIKLIQAQNPDLPAFSEPHPYN